MSRIGSYPPTTTRPSHDLERANDCECSGMAAGARHSFTASERTDTTSHRQRRMTMTSSNNEALIPGARATSIAHLQEDSSGHLRPALKHCI
ncbi:hypothetical protein BST61_g10025 [Cercospora zeina]